MTEWVFGLRGGLDVEGECNLRGVISHIAVASRRSPSLCYHGT